MNVFCQINAVFRQNDEAIDRENLCAVLENKPEEAIMDVLREQEFAPTYQIGRGKERVGLPRPIQPGSQ